MGVPKFYRWISERYPCLSEVVKEYQIPEFDNLYLDMNGIIHNCSHPEDDNPHFRITEQKIFLDIFHYIEVLFRMIRPKKTFFLAIDGVAPRAKMNQQRGRRFRSAQEAQKVIDTAVSKGEVLPKEDRFDSNCITPGTEFMVKLQDQLKYFIAKKMSSDSMWKECKVILSGHETPGEGEHKIMDYIRHEKSMEGYDANTRHCLYGLDADLIMLGLTTHEPHFSLLREEVKFGKQNKKKPVAPEEITFHLLHLSLMREYLDYEFTVLKNTLKTFPYNLENIIDDWVFMGFLVGNDFIPHLPNLHIHQDALPLLWKTYIEVLPSLGGYLHDGGVLNLKRFEIYMSRLSQYDFEKFDDHFADLRWFQGKSEEKSNGNSINKQIRTQFGDDSIITASELANLTGMGVDFTDKEKQLDDTEQTEEDSGSSDESGESLMRREFRMHKDNYYMDKLEYPRVDEAVLREQATEYVKGLQWILHYYYNGVPSWSWFYPFHYAPYISDIKDFNDFEIEFELSQPFLPFEQLMGVLPAASKKLLPEPFQRLMTDQLSPIIDFYPSQFSLDLNGKQQDWEAVVKIPFIDEKRLLDAMASLYIKLRDSEKRRNKHGPHILCEYSDQEFEPYYSPLQARSFPNLMHNHCRIIELHKDYFRLKRECILKGIMKDALTDVYFPGFPTLKHLPHRAYLTKAGVKVFQMNSRSENFILKLLDNKLENLDKIAEKCINREVFVSWPHLSEVKATELLTEIEKYVYDYEKNCVIKVATMKEDFDNFKSQSLELSRQYKSRWGVEIGDVKALIRGKPLSGKRYEVNHDGSVTLVKLYHETQEYYALQSTVFDLKVAESKTPQITDINKLFVKDSTVFVMSSENYGKMAKVKSVSGSNISLITQKITHPSLSVLCDKYEKRLKQYLTNRHGASFSEVSSLLFSRITGVLSVAKHHGPNALKTNIGLNLKSNKKDLEVPGFSWRNPITKEWFFSTRAARDVVEFKKKFPRLFENLERILPDSGHTVSESALLDGCGYNLQDIKKFISGLPSSAADRLPCGSEVLNDEDISLLETTIAESNFQSKREELALPSSQIFRPSHLRGSEPPDPRAEYFICDRVINVRDGYTVPIGLTGTIIGIYLSPKVQDTIYEVLFDEQFVGSFNIRGSNGKGYRMPGSALINISHGQRKIQTSAPRIREFPFSQSSSHRTRYDNQKNHQGHPINSKPQNKPKTRQSDDTEYQKFWSDLAEKSKYSPKILQRDSQFQKGREQREEGPSLADAAKKLPMPETAEEKKEKDKDKELNLAKISGTAATPQIPMPFTAQMPRVPIPDAAMELRELAIRFRFNINTCKVDMGYMRSACQIKIPEMSIAVTGPASENDNIATQLAYSVALQQVKMALEKSTPGVRPIFHQGPNGPQHPQQGQPVRSCFPVASFVDYRSLMDPRFVQGEKVPYFYGPKSDVVGLTGQVLQQIKVPAQQSKKETPEKSKPSVANAFLPLQVQRRITQKDNGEKDVDEKRGLSSKDDVMKAIADNVLSYLTKDSPKDQYSRLEVLGYIAAQRRLILKKKDMDKFFENAKISIDDIREALEEDEIKEEFKTIIRLKLVNVNELEMMFKKVEENNGEDENRKRELVQYLTNKTLETVLGTDEESFEKQPKQHVQAKQEVKKQDIRRDEKTTKKTRKDNEREEKSRAEEITPAANEMLRILENLSLKETPKETESTVVDTSQSEQKSTEAKPRRNRLAANFSLN